MTPGRRDLPLADAAAARGVVVVVDVLRAYTTAAAALDRGAREIVLVETVERALELRAALAGALAMGEVDGWPVPGFDLSNSPVEAAARADLDGRVLVHRSTAGTRGAVRARGATQRWGGAFVTAAATAAALRATAPDTVTYLVTGASKGRDGDEDRALADYLHGLLAGAAPDADRATARVPRSDAGRLFGTPPWPAEDVAFACDVDRFDFALRIDDGEHGPVVRAHREAAS